MREERQIWGVIISNGHRYCMTDFRPRPTPATWMLPGTLRWEVIDLTDSKSDEKDNEYYRSMWIVFGANAVIEMYDNPTVVKVVEFFTGDDSVSE